MYCDVQHLSTSNVSPNLDSVINAVLFLEKLLNNVCTLVCQVNILHVYLPITIKPLVFLPCHVNISFTLPMSGKLFFYSCLVNISITWKCRWTFHFPMSCKHFLYLWQVNFSPTWVHKQSLQQVLFARVVADGEATQLLYVVPPLGFFCQTLPDLIQGLPIKHIKEFNGEHIKLIEVMIVQILPTLEKVKSFKPT